jgi:hypothetical protein
VDLIPDVLPVIGYIGWNLRHRRLSGEPPSRQILLSFFRETMQL